MKTKNLSFVIALLTLFSITTAFAQSPKLKSPLRTTDKGLTMEMCYDISGLGNVDNIIVTCEYDATVTSLCFNPGASTGPVPGQTKTFGDTSEEIVIPVHNGRAVGCFTTTTAFPAGACPNTKWTGQVSDVSFSNITLTVDGKEFTASNPR